MKVAGTHIATALFAVASATIFGVWSWLGTPVEMPQGSFAPGAKLDCVSYAPFRGTQNPLEAGTHIEPWQIDADLAQLKRVTNCVRTYSIDHGTRQDPGTRAAPRYEGAAWSVAVEPR